MKHWQLFLLLFVLPMLLNFTVFLRVIPSRNPYEQMEAFRTFPIWQVGIWLFQVAGTVSWLVAVYRRCIADTPAYLRPRSYLLWIALVYVVVWVLLFLTFWITMIRSIPPPGQRGADMPVHPAVFLAMFPLTMLGMVAVIYCFVILARVFKTWELQREVQAGEYIGEVFLFFFWYVGLWFVQPKLNLLAQGKRPVPWYPPHPPGTPPQAPPQIPHDF